MSVTSTGDYESRRGTRASTFCGGAIFVDHATGYIQIQHQVSFGASDTVQSKLQFETAAMDDGVIVQGYHTDNGVLSSQEFLEEMLSKGQNVCFSGSGAAHQNGVAERSILSMVCMARSMMMHAALKQGSGVVTQSLWPMAVDHAVWLYNRIPHSNSGLSPLELWSRSTMMNVSDTLANCHVWGCHTFVLDPKLRKDGVKIPKWAPRSRQGVNLGYSRKYSSLIALVLNPKTGSITPQFHVVFDDIFSTVPHNDSIDTESWRTLIMSPHEENRVYTPVDDASDLEIADEWLEPDELGLRLNTRRREASVQQNPSAFSPVPFTNSVSETRVPNQREQSRVPTIVDTEASLWPNPSTVQTTSVIQPRTLLQALWLLDCMALPFEPEIRCARHCFIWMKAHLTRAPHSPRPLGSSRNEAHPNSMPVPRVKVLIKIKKGNMHDFEQ